MTTSLKGKVERRFHYAETSLLNGRTFESLEHLNEIAVWWLANVADPHVLRDFKESPRDRHERERPHQHITVFVLTGHVGILSGEV